MKDWEIIADNLSKAGWSWGCVSAIDSNRRTIWIADHLRRGFARLKLCAHLLEARSDSFNLLLLLGVCRITLSPASVVGHRDLHLLARRVAAAVGTGDGDRIDPAIAVARPLGSK